MADRECPSCGTSFTDTLTCPSCGHNLASSVVSTGVDTHETHTDAGSVEEMAGSEQRSASQLASAATGNITEKFLKKTDTVGDIYLYDGPLIDYLWPEEQPEYILQGGSGGLHIVKADETKEQVHPVDATGRRYLLVTDQRVLSVTGCKEGDRSHSVDFDEIIGVGVDRGLTQGKLSFETTDGTKYMFETTRHAGVVHDAATYLSEQTSAETDLPNSVLSNPSETQRVRQNIASVLIIYGIIAAVGWFLLPRLLAPGFSDPAFGQEPWSFAETQRRVGGFIVVISVVGMLWHSFDALEQVRPRISIIGRRIISGIACATVGLFSTGFSAAIFADAGVLEQQSTLFQIIILAGVIVGFVFGFAVGDDPWPTEDWRFTERD